MAAIRTLPWRKLPISLTELCLDTTLRCGQSFRWRKSDDNIWSCALHGRVLSLRQDSSHLHYRAIYTEAPDVPPTPPLSAPGSISEQQLDDDDTEDLVRHYLNIGPNLTDLYEQWSTADMNFKKKAPRFTGVRILKQDAWEALVGFICSSNNNIIRISQMMEKLCAHYGSLIGHINEKPFYDMPVPAALAHSSVESTLRQLGFGYRARYLYETAVMLTKDHDVGWLDNLRNPESPVLGQKVSSAGEMLLGGRAGYRAAHAELLTLQGVGPKVADCICLMGLGWGEAVPVDTHVWQIAQRDYHFGKGKHRSLTPATYDAIGNHFRGLWGKEAGWAHSVLFAADLKAFSERLLTKVEITEVKIEPGLENPNDQIIKKEIELDAAIKVEPKQGIKRILAVDETTGSTRTKRKRAS